MEKNLQKEPVQLFWIPVEETGNEALEARCLEILSPAEREKHQRFRYDRDRRLYLAAHTLLRATLSRIGDQPPDRWSFSTNEHGKPYLDPAAGDPPLRFNLTHCAGLAACVVAAGPQLGLDAENLDRRIDLKLADRFFSPVERAQLEGLPGDERRQAFFDIWTLKESYVKGRGIGVSLPLRSFGFTLADEDSGTITFSPPAEDRADRWSFFRFRPGSHHTLAVAVNHRPGAVPRVSASRIHTLADLL